MQRTVKTVQYISDAILIFSISVGFLHILDDTKFGFF